MSCAVLKALRFCLNVDTQDQTQSRVNPTGTGGFTTASFHQSPNVAGLWEDSLHHDG